MTPPLHPRPDRLPLEDHTGLFTWATFEGFLCAFLSTGTVIKPRDGMRAKIDSARLQPGPGRKQKGIDIVAQVTGIDAPRLGRETWVFQCKYYKNWSESQSRRAMVECTYEADRKFLVVTKYNIADEARTVVEAEADWEFWSGETLSSHFLNPDVISRAQASRLLFTYFGEGWAKAMLGLPGHLVTPEVYFANLQRARSADPAYPAFATTLVGRESELKKLDAFAAHSRHRVGLLVAPGGRGKTRLLREWALHLGDKKRLGKKAPTVRFLLPNRIDSDFVAAITAERRPLLLVLDDAHQIQLDQTRRAVFAELVQLENVKVLLALRPGIEGTVRGELDDAGLFPASNLSDPITIPPLDPSDARALVREVAPTLPAPQAAILARLSRECPLIAEMAGRLLAEGSLAIADIRDEPAFRDHVFERLLRVPETITKDWGASRVNELLELIALIAPVEPNEAFREKAAQVLAQNTRPHEVSDMITALIDHGLMVEFEHVFYRSRQVRISPDLLSDHLAYRACDDRPRSDSRPPRNRGFVQRVLDHFSADDFPRIIQNLADAEWRAGPNADSVCEPLWRWFNDAFEQPQESDMRPHYLDLWRSVAHLQPRRTLKLAEKIKTKHPSLVEKLPGLLQPVGERHADHATDVLDQLWRLATSSDDLSIHPHPTPLDAIATILAVRETKPPELHRAVLPWIRRILAEQKWMQASPGPGPVVVLEHLLSPLFAGTSSETTWDSQTTLTWWENVVPIRDTAWIRVEARAICRELIDRRDARLALAVVPVLDHAVRPIHVMNTKLPRNVLDAWDEERIAALELFAHLFNIHTDPAVRFVAGRELRDSIKFVRETETYKNAARAVLAKIPDTPVQRLARLCLGHALNDMVDHPGASRGEERAHWERFTDSVADEILRAHGEPLSLFDHLNHHVARWETLGLRPNVRPLIAALGRLSPETALTIARHLLAQPDQPSAVNFDAWANAGASADPTLRRFLYESALKASPVLIRRAALNGLSFWRKNGDLPPALREAIFDQTAQASPEISRDLADHVWLNSEHIDDTDWKLLAAIPAHDASVALYVFKKTSELLEHAQPTDPALALTILDQLRTCPTLDDVEFDYVFAPWVRHYPKEVFQVFWDRLVDTRTRDTADTFFAYLRESNLESALPVLWQGDDFLALFSDIEQRIPTAGLSEGEARLVRFAMSRMPDTIAQRLTSAISKLTAEGALRSVVLAFEDEIDDSPPPFIVKHAALVRALLVKAREFGADTYAEVFDHFAHIDDLGRPSSNGTLDAHREAIFALQAAAHEYASDPELGTLYAKALKHEKDFVAAGPLTA